MGRTRTLVAALTCVVSWLAPEIAGADDKRACVEAHAQSQKLRRRGRLREARRELMACSAVSCPGAVEHDCATWLNEVQAEVPSVVITARDETGSDLVAVRVDFDGELLASRLTGAPLEVDPGEHTFRYELGDGRVVERQVVIRAGEKGAPLRVDFALRASPAAEGSPPARAPRVPILAFVVAGFGVAALGLFTGLAVDGYARERSLARSCSPGCTPAQVDRVSTEYHVADVSLATGVVALGVATWIALAHGGGRIAF